MCRSDNRSRAKRVQKLSSGQTLGALVPGQRVSAIVLLPSTQCFSCASMIREWQELAKRRMVTVRVVFLNKSSEDDRRLAQIARLPLAGELARALPETQADGSPNIIELLFAAGTIVDVARFGARNASSRLKREATSRSVCRLKVCDE